MYIVVRDKEHLEQLKAERKKELHEKRKALRRKNLSPNVMVLCDDPYMPGKTKQEEHPENTKFLEGQRHKRSQKKLDAKIAGCTEIEDIYPAVVYFRDRGICGICGKYVPIGIDMSLDHKIPLSKGGQHTYDNIQLAHRGCNASKWNKLPEETI